MEFSDLKFLYDEAEGLVADSETVPEDAESRLIEIRESIDELADGDVAEWVERYYREKYRDDSYRVCTCRNPACTYKRGKMAYSLRQPSSSLTTTDTTIEQRIRNELKRHPDARVLDDALDELRARKREAVRALIRLIRDCRDELRAEHRAAAGDVVDSIDDEDDAVGDQPVEAER
jgi:hypothetical protein